MARIGIAVRTRFSRTRAAIAGIRAAAGDAHQLILDSALERDLGQWQKRYRGTLDGLITTADPDDPATRSALVQMRIPVVFLEWPAPRWMLRSAGVLIDKSPGGRLAALAFRRRHVRTVVALGRDDWRWRGLEAGLAAACREVGLGYAGRMARLGSGLRRDCPLGIVTLGSSHAVAALRQLASLGLAVPALAQVIAGDDEDVLIAGHAPPISALADDLEAAGRRALVLLAARIADPALPRQTERIPVHGIIHRATTASDSGDAAIDRALERLDSAAIPPRRVPAVLATLPVQRRQAERRFRAATGTSPRRALEAARIARAMELLRQPGATCLAVALALGYSGANRFSEAFRRVVGMPPQAWRNR